MTAGAWKRKIGIAFVFLVLVAIGCVSVFWTLSRPDPLPLPAKPDQAGVVRVVSANLLCLNGRAREVTDALLKTDFDIGLLLEWTGKNALRQPLLEKGYAVLAELPLEGTHGIGILAKANLPGQAEVMRSPFPGPCRMPLVVGRFSIAGKSIDVAGIHAPPPVPACRESNLPMLTGVSGWIRDGKLARELVFEGNAESLILLGDFNLESTRSKIRMFREAGMTDASGLGAKPRPTWSPIGLVPPLIRIDYIFSGKGIRPLRSFTFSLPGSDHRGVAADLQIP
jgi:endonuclease/exonuclease/phosphatase family metal-dependent hydrolase